MKLKYYLRGMGIGMIITAIVMGIALNGRKETLSDAEIMARARELGMIDSTVLSDYAAQGVMGDAMGGAGDMGNAADGSAGASVRSVTQSGEAGSHRVVFEKIDPVEQPTSADAGTGALKSGEKKDEANSAASDNGNRTGKESGDSSKSTEEGKKAADASGVMSRENDTAKKTADAATADTAKKTADAATADTAKKTADAATADTAKKTADAATTDTAKKTADAATADTAKNSADASPAAGNPEPAATGSTATTSSDTPAPASAGGVRTIVIPSGVGSETVSRILADAGLVDSAATYDKYLCDNRVDRSIRSGTMSIPEGATWDQIKDIITR
ncbi:MAG: hypothetical protein K6C95_09520 [Lachnospiraceae bacterium]|nr:hypothetical protein [Lachnospiraceae bacterium]